MGLEYVSNGAVLALRVPGRKHADVVPALDGVGPTAGSVAAELEVEIVEERLAVLVLEVEDLGVEVLVVEYGGHGDEARIVELEQRHDDLEEDPHVHSSGFLADDDVSANALEGVLKRLIRRMDIREESARYS